MSLAPYYRDDAVTLYHADALDLLRSLPAASVDLVATDPPYFGVKDDAWDRAWPNAAAFLAWIGELCDEWRRVLRPNGSLYVFASPAMAGRVEGVVRERFDVLNHIVWRKPESNADRRHAAQLVDKALERAWFDGTERVIFAEQVGCEYRDVARLVRLDVFAPLGAYLSAARTAVGLERNDVDVALGYVRTKNPARGTELCRRWEEGSSLPTPADYDRLRALYGVASLPRSYADLAAEADHLRAEFERERRAHEHKRRPFSVAGARHADAVWEYGPAQPRPGSHPCEKPLAMCEDIVRASSRPGAVVLDTFAGSGAMLDAARNLGRRAIGGDSSAHWCRYAAQRLSQGTLFTEVA